MRLILLSLLGLAASSTAIVEPALAAASAVPVVAQARFADGTYTGTSANAYYGNIQVQVVIQSGAITGFKLMDYPSHTRTSVAINQQALPILAQEIIAAQSTRVDIVSGATLSSEAFLRSVASALPN